MPSINEAIDIDIDDLESILDLYRNDLTATRYIINRLVYLLEIAEHNIEVQALDDLAGC